VGPGSSAQPSGRRGAVDSGLGVIAAQPVSARLTPRRTAARRGVRTQNISAGIDSTYAITDVIRWQLRGEYHGGCLALPVKTVCVWWTADSRIPGQRHLHRSSVGTENSRRLRSDSVDSGTLTGCRHRDTLVFLTQRVGDQRPSRSRKPPVSRRGMAQRHYLHGRLGFRADGTLT